MPPPGSPGRSFPSTADAPEAGPYRSTSTRKKPMDDSSSQPWIWEESLWREKVEHVRAGRSLKPARWKNGARCAVAFSFDSDHETNELRDGGRSIGRMSQGQYGNRQGVPRILNALAKYDAKATFFVPAVAALLYEDEQRRVVAGRHEIGPHRSVHQAQSPPPEQD